MPKYVPVLPETAKHLRALASVTNQPSEIVMAKALRMYAESVAGDLSRRYREMAEAVEALKGTTEDPDAAAKSSTKRNGKVPKPGNISRAVANSWARLTPAQRKKRVAAIRAGHERRKAARAKGSEPKKAKASAAKIEAAAKARAALAASRARLAKATGGESPATSAE